MVGDYMTYWHDLYLVPCVLSENRRNNAVVSTRPPFVLKVANCVFSVPTHLDVMIKRSSP